MLVVPSIWERLSTISRQASEEELTIKKKTYEVYGHCNVICNMHVKAFSPEEAIEIANEEFGGLTNYCGMGSTECLVGVLTSEDHRCIMPDSDVEFDDCKESDHERKLH